MCARTARYLVAVPYGSFFPYCRDHMTQVIAHACDQQYRDHPAGQREPVQVLPTDERS